MGHLDDLEWLQGEVATEVSGPPGAARTRPRTDLARRQPRVVGANYRVPDASEQRVPGAEPDPACWTVTQTRLRPRRVGVASAGARARTKELHVGRGRGYPHPWITKAVAGVYAVAKPPSSLLRTCVP